MATERASAMLSPGTRFGRYEVIAELASGGMATVYLGRALGHGGFQRLVALKLLHPHLARDEEFVAMFMDEARLAAMIRHPNVVATLDFENDADDGLFLVMEYVEGDSFVSLEREMAKADTAVPAPVVMRIVLDILNGLHAAHELKDEAGTPLKIVHRDVSPHNILVGTDGIARITDFGIARADERVSTTRNGQVKGKLSYMAPEQTSASPIDRRADLFSAGVVLWEGLTGKRLFAGKNDGEVLRNLLVNPIPKVRDLAPEMPEALEKVCMRALARDADGRFATAAQFADALEAAAASVGIARASVVAEYVSKTSGVRISALQQQTRKASVATTTPSATEVRVLRAKRRELDESEPQTRSKALPERRTGVLRYVAILAAGLTVGVAAIGYAWMQHRAAQVSRSSAHAVAVMPAPAAIAPVPATAAPIAPPQVPAPAPTQAAAPPAPAAPTATQATVAATETHPARTRPRPAARPAPRPRPVRRSRTYNPEAM